MVFTAEQKYKLLLEISHAIRDTLDLDDILGRLLDTVQTLLGFDAAGIFILNRETGPARPGGIRPAIAGIAQRGFDPHPIEEDQMLVQGLGIIGHVIRTGECVVAPDVREDPRYIVGRRATRSEIAVPIQQQGRPFGALDLESDRSNAFGPDDLEVLRFFADAAAISIDKAMLHRQLMEQRRVEDQLRTAREVVARLLPEAPPEVSGYDLAGLCLPAFEIGGDYLDYFFLPDGRLGLVVADVSGKGIPAALIMATFRALLRSHAHAGLEPAPLLAAVSHQLYDCTGPETFVTAFYGALDPASGRFVYSRAGHNPPLWIGAGGSVRRLEEGGGLMGIAEEASFHSGEVAIAPGDALVLYTDGVVELTSTNEEDFGLPRLEDLALNAREAGARALVDRVIQSTREFSGAESYSDDFTLMILRRLPGAAG